MAKYLLQMIYTSPIIERLNNHTFTIDGYSIKENKYRFADSS